MDSTEEQAKPLGGPKTVAAADRSLPALSSTPDRQVLNVVQPSPLSQRFPGGVQGSLFGPFPDETPSRQPEKVVTSLFGLPGRASCQQQAEEVTTPPGPSVPPGTNANGISPISRGNQDPAHERDFMKGQDRDSDGGDDNDITAALQRQAMQKRDGNPSRPNSAGISGAPHNYNFGDATAQYPRPIFRSFLTSQFKVAAEQNVAGEEKTNQPVEQVADRNPRESSQKRPLVVDSDDDYTPSNTRNRANTRTRVPQPPRAAPARNKSKASKGLDELVRTEPQPSPRGKKQRTSALDVSRSELHRETFPPVMSGALPVPPVVMAQGVIPGLGHEEDLIPETQTSQYFPLRLSAGRIRPRTEVVDATQTLEPLGHNLMTGEIPRMTTAQTPSGMHIDPENRGSICSPMFLSNNMNGLSDRSIWKHPKSMSHSQPNASRRLRICPENTGHFSSKSSEQGIPAKTALESDNVIRQYTLFRTPRFTPSARETRTSCIVRCIENATSAGANEQAAARLEGIRSGFVKKVWELKENGLFGGYVRFNDGTVMYIWVEIEIKEAAVDKVKSGLEHAGGINQHAENNGQGRAHQTVHKNG